jgi:hypothetical protein
MGLDRQKIRATITMPNYGTVTNENVLSFNVNKTRGQKSTFNASVKIHLSTLSSLTNNEISIAAGEEGNVQTIFTGYILSSNATPCFEDPEYIVLNLSGADALYKLEGTKYTRRQIESKHKWATINGVVREAPVSGAFNLKASPTPILSVDHKIPEQKEDKTTLNIGAGNLSVTRKDVLGNPLDFKFSEYKDIPKNQ